MKSIYLRSFAATAATVAMCFLIIALSFVGIGRNYVISEYRENMEHTADEVARMASAVSRSDSLSSWVLSMSISSIGKSTGNHVFITDPSGKIVSCSDQAPVCGHLGMIVPEEVILQVTEENYDELSTLGGMYKGQRYVAAVPIEAVGDGTVLGFAFVTN